MITEQSTHAWPFDAHIIYTTDRALLLPHMPQHGSKDFVVKGKPMRTQHAFFIIRSCNHACPIQGEKVAATDIALTHLHTNGILHRDLSSNNILLNDIHRAKVTDFGMSKIADHNPSMTRSKVTQCPGTLVYMPPEAVSPQPHYSDKVDSFSIGVLLLQIITRIFPDPTKELIEKEDPNSPIGKSYVPVPEVDCRKSDIDKISATHSFLPIALNCLEDMS